MLARLPCTSETNRCGRVRVNLDGSIVSASLLSLARSIPITPSALVTPIPFFGGTQALIGYEADAIFFAVRSPVLDIGEFTPGRRGNEVDYCMVAIMTTGTKSPARSSEQGTVNG